MHLNLLLSPSSVSVIAWSWGNLSAVAIREAIAGHENQVKFISEPDQGMYEAILMKMAWKVPQFIQGKVYVKLCLECGLEAMVAWSWTELAVNGIKDSPKKESEILIKMFHI